MLYNFIYQFYCKFQVQAFTENVTHSSKFALTTDLKGDYDGLCESLYNID